MAHLNKYENMAAYNSGSKDTPAFSLVADQNKVIYDAYITNPGNGVYIKYTDGTYSDYNKLISGKTPVGVALKTSACALLLHPSEGASKQWSTNTSTQISGVTTTTDQATAKVDYAGRANTTAVVNSGLAGSAFTFATGAVYADGSDGWLPSCGEMEQMRMNEVKINNALALIGGTPLDFEGKWYWSSTQYSAGNSWNWRNSYSLWFNLTKDRISFCRSVSAF